MSDSALRVYDADELRQSGQYAGYPMPWALPNETGIKDQVRELAGHRCVRCLHPYRTGESPPEWSPCDMKCRHQGPVRHRAVRLSVDEEPTPWNFLDEWPPDDFYTETGLLVWADAEVQARWRILTTHHLNGNKADCRWWNLAALCQRCHLTIQGRVRMEQVYPHEHTGWFKPYAAGYYAWAYNGENLTREQTMARLDELLALERMAA